MFIEWLLKPSPAPIKSKSTHIPKYFQVTDEDLKNVWD